MFVYGKLGLNDISNESPCIGN